MTRLFVLCIFIALYLCSCHSITRIDDVVKNSTTFQWSGNIHVRSSKLRTQRAFHLLVEKDKNTPDLVRIDIRSHFPVTQLDIHSHAWFILDHNTYDFPLHHIRDNIHYTEAINRVATTTTARTDITTDKTTSVKPVSNPGSTTAKATKTTDTTTTSSTSTNTDVSVDRSIVDRIYSERTIHIPIDIFKSALGNQNFTIRLYTESENDFWDLRITESRKISWLKLSNNIYDKVRR